ncbi:hypothetical protein Lal_00020338 [Lupinus albus]|uniref:Uncharacterized protein n=1 Tax=Lupinus albus TaxID=3870 RepID=A0A6A5MAB1_LUPAL|nr:hypothetical protein Lalb_Chr08g0240871 [Lupinus albus]KAF1871544.1 hypothetical protein Lal_00020338 [Lupinus albus]
MDREQEEMQTLGLFGVYKESCRIILSWRKIFSQITLTLILPLSFIFLGHIEVSNVLFRKILNSTEQMMDTPQNTPKYQKLSQMLSSEWATFWLFKFFYFTTLLIFSLLSTSAVVYTIASIYTARYDVTFNKVMSVVPKVWKRLMVTFLCTFFVFFAYNIMAVLVMVIYILTIGVHIESTTGMAISGFIVITYLIGLVYLSVTWQLASVVSVLEDSYGVQAMMKSKNLIKGKMGLSILIFLKLGVSFISIQFLFRKFVVQGWSLGSLDRTAYGVFCLLLLSLFFLYGLVLQTVFYFVCKSYHHENIDKSDLSDHLEVYLGEYEPLKTKDVQLEQYQV